MTGWVLGSWICLICTGISTVWLIFRRMWPGVLISGVVFGVYCLILL